ncbi:MAG: zinc ribbon domain-containing protein [Prevotellaceae bacterium]|jgi:preprotein translocase subunit YajC|nr:zinc ribbon domain-containing protein [Prevotellaceae bacterium]
MKICPKCETENASAANFCVKCGAILSEEDLDEITLLQRELNNANDTISNLNKQIKTAEEQEKKYKESQKEIQSLKFGMQSLKTEHAKCGQIIAEKDRQNVALVQQNADLVKRSKKGGNNNLMSLFAALFILATIMAIVYYVDNGKQQKKNSKLEIEIRDLTQKKENTVSQEEYSLLQQQNSDLKKKNDVLSETVKKMKYSSPAPKPSPRYTAISSPYFSYKDCAGNFITFTCRPSYGEILTVYTQEKGYGLTSKGWIEMSSLTKQ